MPLFLLSVLVQIALIVHVLRTGRDTRWIFLLLFVPGIGAIIYLLIEVLPGIYADDPELLLGLAGAQFGAGEPAAAIATLDRLKEKSPEHRSPDGHLLYARALEAAGNTARARHEYETLAKYFAGAEAKVRFGLFLKNSGHAAEGTELLRTVLEDAKLAPRHFRRGQKEWLDMARGEL